MGIIRVLGFLFRLWLRMRSPQGKLIGFAGKWMMGRMLRKYNSSYAGTSDERWQKQDDGGD